MLRYGGLIGSDCLRDVGDAHFGLAKQVEHPQAARMGERLRDPGFGFILVLVLHGYMAI